MSACKAASAPDPTFVGAAWVVIPGDPDAAGRGEDVAGVVFVLEGIANRTGEVHAARLRTTAAKARVGRQYLFEFIVPLRTAICLDRLPAWLIDMCLNHPSTYCDLSV